MWFIREFLACSPVPLLAQWMDTVLACEVMGSHPGWAIFCYISHSISFTVFSFFAG